VAAAGGNVVQTEVTYAPSPRRMGKKRVQLNPIHTVAGDYPLEAGNYKPPVPVLQQNGNDFGANVTIIGGTQVLVIIRNIIWARHATFCGLLLLKVKKGTSLLKQKARSHRIVLHEKTICFVIEPRTI
jgi:hypothetical protein